MITRAQDRARAPLGQRHGGETTLAGAIPRILLIEANAVIGLELSDLLTLEGGYSVCAVASSAQEAVDAIEQYQPDLVLADLRVILDAGLPVEVIKRGNHGVILFTGDRPAGEEQMHLGTACLLKPFSGPTLLAEVSDCLQRRAVSRSPA
jgi:DNA-binding response OmpR family regulator